MNLLHNFSTINTYKEKNTQKQNAQYGEKRCTNKIEIKYILSLYEWSSVWLVKGTIKSNKFRMSSYYTSRQ